MSLFWTIRITVVILLFVQVSIFGYFIRNRGKYQKLLENTALNIVLVIVYNFLCYFSVLLPADENVFPKPELLKDPRLVTWFNVVGLVLCVSGVLLLLVTLRQRKAVGGQDTSGKLLTTGIYKHFRHPIYSGIVLVSLALALCGVNFDAMIVVPLIFLANFFEAKLEEKFDMVPRFGEEYQAYKKKTLAFGSIWLWLIILASIIAPIILFSVV